MRRRCWQNADPDLAFAEIGRVRMAMKEQRDVDLLVAGAGPAGMTAALVASLQGLTVLVCEKSGQVGGTGSTSAGTLWIPGNRQSQKAGFDDSAARAADYLDAL